jgi:hypothetical protein
VVHVSREMRRVEKREQPWDGMTTFPSPLVDDWTTLGQGVFTFTSSKPMSYLHTHPHSIPPHSPSAAPYRARCPPSTPSHPAARPLLGCSPHSRGSPPRPPHSEPAPPGSRDSCQTLNTTGAPGLAREH